MLSKFTVKRLCMDHSLGEAIQNIQDTHESLSSPEYGAMFLEKSPLVLRSGAERKLCVFWTTKRYCMQWRLAILQHCGIQLW